MNLRENESGLRENKDPNLDGYLEVEVEAADMSDPTTLTTLQQSYRRRKNAKAGGVQADARPTEVLAPHHEHQRERDLPEEAQDPATAPLLQLRLRSRMVMDISRVRSEAGRNSMPTWI